MIKLKSSGGFRKTEKFLESVSSSKIKRKEEDVFNRYVNDLLSSLSEATPKDTGETAFSWTYKISREGDKVKLNIYNTHIVDGVCIAIILQYGHATNGGGYVPGVNYINPSAKPIFDTIEHEFWKEVVT